MLSQATNPLRYRASVDLSYDPLGNITYKEQTSWVDSYDMSGNLTDSAPGRNMYIITPSYTGNRGNPSPRAPTSITQSYPVGATTQLTYDINGNLTSSATGGNTRMLTWTDTDRLRSACDGVAPTCSATYTQALYSADGVRTHNKATNSGTVSETLYVNQFLTVRNGSLPTKHVYVGDARVASKMDISGGSTKTYWYHSDNIQSTNYVTTTGQAVACLKDGLSPTNFYAAQLHGKLAYHEFEGISVNPGEWERFVRDLAGKPAMILRNHGLLAWGSSVAQAFMTLWTLQRACDIQIASSAAGALHPIRDEVFEQMVRESGPGEQRTCDDVFAAMVRLVEMKDRSYRD